MNPRFLAAVAGALLPFAAVTAQPATKQLTFDVASIKLAAVPAGVTVSGGTVTVPRGSGIPIPRDTGGPGTEAPGRIHYPLISLKTLLGRAYTSYAEVQGPGWLDTQFVEIEARMPATTTKEQLQEMLRNLIVERFRLAYHPDTKNFPAYALVVAGSGLKMREAAASAAPPGQESGPPSRPPMGPDGFPVRSRLAPGQPGAMVFMGQGGRRRMYGQQQTMQDFAKTLEFQLWQDTGPTTRRIPVSDATGLTAKYDYELTYASQGTPDAEPFSDIFGALQSQLGLRLEEKKVPAQVMVIDRMERIPAAN
jgi:uncharacterized protein (TIGR03435 family)